MLDLMPYIIPAVSMLMVSLSTMYIQRNKDHIQRKKDKRNDDATLSERYQEIASKEAIYRLQLETRLIAKIDKLKGDVEKLEAELETDRKLIKEYIEGSDILFEQIERNSDTPEWTPPHRDRRKSGGNKSGKWD